MVAEGCPSSPTSVQPARNLHDQGMTAARFLMTALFRPLPRPYCALQLTGNLLWLLPPTFEAWPNMRGEGEGERERPKRRGGDCCEQLVQ